MLLSRESLANSSSAKNDIKRVPIAIVIFPWDMAQAI